MKARPRIAVARAVLPVFLAVALWLPYKDSRAILPLAIPLVISAIDAAGTVAVGDIVGTAATALIGGTVMALMITPKDAGTGSDGVPIRLPTSTSAGSQTATAPPSAPATATAQASVTYITYYGGAPSSGWCSSFGGSTYAAACGAVGGVLGYLNRCFPPSGANYNTWNFGYAASLGYVNPGSCETGPKCPAGYTVSGSSCILSNPRIVTPDGKQDATRNGTALDKPTEADSSPVPTQIQTTANANDTAVMSGTDGKGNPMRITVQATSDGGSLIKTSVQKTDAGGNTYTENKIVQVGANGTVTGASQNTQAQQLVYNASTGAYEVANTTANSANPGQTQTEPVSFPSDYARSGEAQSAASSVVGAVNANTNTIGAKLDTLHGDLTHSTNPLADPAMPEDYTDFGETFASLKGWQLPGHASQCPTGSFTVPWGTAYTIDAHCRLVQDHWAVLQAAMTAVWTIAALFIVLRA